MLQFSDETGSYLEQLIRVYISKLHNYNILYNNLSKYDEELDYYNLSERKMGDRIIDHGKFKKCDSYSIDLKESQEISVTQRNLPDDQHDETRKVLSFGKSIDNDIAEIFANFEGITFLSIFF